MGSSPLEKLIRYSLSLPVATAVLGMPKIEYLEEDVRIAKAFEPLSRSQMRNLSGHLSSAHKARLDRFLYNHVDA